MLKIILIIIAAVFILKYTINLIKRAILITSVKNKCREKGMQFKKIQPLFKSVFICNGSADFEVGNAIVHIFSPFFRRVRYSFTDDRRLEVIIARKQFFMRNKKIGSGGSTVDNIWTHRSNRLKKLGNTDDGRKHILLVYPIPFEVTRVEDNHVTSAYNGDEIWKNCVFSNKSYFIENIEKFAE